MLGRCPASDPWNPAIVAVIAALLVHGPAAGRRLSLGQGLREFETSARFSAAEVEEPDRGG